MNACLKRTSIKYKQAEAGIPEPKHDAPKTSQLSDKGKEFWNSLCNFSKLTAICIAVCFLLCIVAFLLGKIFAGMIAFVQIAFFIVSCHDTKTMDLTEVSKVDQEMISEKLRWPQNELAQLVPKPKSEFGYILFEAPGEITICVGETTKKEFNIYIDACAEKGFDTNVSRSEGSYFGNNSEGYRLLLDYEENDIMTITVMEPVYLVKIELDCESNLFFSKYDIDVYIDDRLAGTLEHGKKDIFDAELEKGNHTLKVTKEGDTSVDGTARFNVPESIKVSYTLQCSSDGIDIEEGNTEILIYLGAITIWHFRELEQLRWKKESNTNRIGGVAFGSDICESGFGLYDRADYGVPDGRGIGFLVGAFLSFLSTA